jgi:hypothetical protein
MITNGKELIDYANGKINQYPQLAGKIKELFYLAKDEIDAGESFDNEVELFQRDVEQLIKEI